ncbi:MAG: hypothetical protein AB7R87_08780 [Parvibaculaceae bacterium]
MPNTPIESAKYNAATTDLAQALTESVNVQGTAPFQADQPMGGHKLTGLSAGVAAGDSATLGQVQSSIMAHAAVVGGTADAITLTFSPAFSAYIAKMRFRFTATGANTVTAPTVNVDSLGAKTIKKLNGQALVAGDIAGSGHIVDCVYDGTDVLIISASAVSDASEAVKGIIELATMAEVKAGTDPVRVVTPAGLAGATRLKLTTNTTFYVRTGGDDGNDGSANDDDHAFETVQGADDYLNAIDFNGHTVTVQLMDGTFDDTAMIRLKVGLTDASGYVIQGNSSAPGNVIVSTTSANCFTVGRRAMVTIKDMELRTATSGSCLLAYGYLEVGSMIFGAAASHHIRAEADGYIKLTSDYTIAGNAPAHYSADGGRIVTSLSSVTLVDTPLINSFCTATSCGVVVSSGITFSGGIGSGTSRYGVNLNGVIRTGGSGGGYFPGTLSGSIGSGGQYG